MAPGNDSSNNDPTAPKISLNGSANAYTPSVSDSITLALLQNGGVNRIQSTFQQRLDEAGWTQALRVYVEGLFRSGEATTYDDALKVVLARVKVQPTANGANGDQHKDPDDEDETAEQDDGDRGKGSKMGTNGSADASFDLAIPRDAARDAAEVVKKELAQIVRLER